MKENKEHLNDEQLEQAAGGAWDDPLPPNIRYWTSESCKGTWVRATPASGLKVGDTFFISPFPGRGFVVNEIVPRIGGTDCIVDIYEYGPLNFWSGRYPIMMEAKRF